MGQPLAAVVLAAGASTRMGRPKALIRWRGRSFVEHVVGLASRCAPRVLVGGASELPAAARAAATIFVLNREWRAGQMSSVQCGLSVVPRDCAVLVLTVDRPHIDGATIDALIAAWSSEPDMVWQPEHGGRRGHPLIYPPDVVRAMSVAAPGATQRTVLEDFARRRRTLPMDDAAVLDNLDRPEDLVRLGDVEL